MNVLRWIVFIPYGFITIAIAQFVTGSMAEKMNPWISIPMVIFFGIIVAMATGFPVLFAPEPKIAAAILLTLFLIFEFTTLISHISTMKAHVIAIRILTDIYLVIGGIFSATMKDKPK